MGINFIFRLSLLTTFCAFLNYANAKPGQIPKPKHIGIIMEKYKDELFIILSRDEKYTICLEDGKLKVKRYRTERYLYIKNPAVLSAERYLASSSFNELTGFSAYSFKPNGSRYTKTKINSHTKSNTITGNIFHDDEVRFHFLFPGISRGAVIELNSEHTVNEPRFMPALFLQSAVPIHRYTCQIICSNNINLNLREFNSHGAGFTMEQKELKGKKIYQISAHEVPPVPDEQNQPPIRYTIWHIVPSIESYAAAGKNETFLSGPADLHSWYRSLIDTVNSPNVLERLRPLADSLTNGLAADEDKAKAIFYWVQNSIKYIAFEAGMGGIVPRNADFVAAVKYGDCKDKTSLMHALMQLSGLQAYFAWIGTDDLPYTYAQLPTPASDNHMILALKTNSGYRFLDATTTGLNYYMPTSFIQGKEALVSINKDSFALVTVPIVEARANLVRNDLEVKIAPCGSLSAQGRSVLFGYPKLFYRQMIRDVSDREFSRLSQEMFCIGNNKCSIESFSAGASAASDSSMQIELGLKVPNYALIAGDMMFVNLNLKREWAAYGIDANRKTPLMFRYKSSSEHQYKLDVPEGYKVASLPPDAHFSSPKFSFSIKYSATERQITYTHSIEIRSREVYVPDFAEWREFIKSLSDAYRQVAAFSLIK
jgi:hypothetical protein